MALTVEEVAKVKEYIKVYYPSLLSDENLDFLIEDAADTLSARYFGKHYPKAVAYLTMHNASIASQTASSGSGGSEGIVVQKTIGPVTIKYADGSSHYKGWNALYGSTKFGLMLISLVKLCSGGGSITVNNAWRIL